MLKKGDEMTSLIIIFVGCIVVMFVAIWTYNKSEDTAFHKTMTEINELKTKNKELADLLQSNIGTIANSNLRIQELEKVKANIEGIASDLRKEVDNVQDHCAKLRESQINLQDMLSKKRPVIRPTGPIQVEIFTSDKSPASPHAKQPLGRGLKSLLPEQQPPPVQEKQPIPQPPARKKKAN